MQRMHTYWLAKLDSMINDMVLLPLQINSQKCAFGHFYCVIGMNSVNNSVIVNEWNKIGDVHKKFHSLGAKVVSAIERDNRGEAQNYRNEAENLSKTMLDALDLLISEVNKMSAKGVSVF